MEYEKENKLGAGIIIISILYIVAYSLSILGSLLGPALITSEMASQYGLSKESMTASVIPNVIVAIVMIAACIMLLLKQKIGVFLFIFAVLASIIMTIVTSGFVISSLLISLILPALMVLFISKKKELYGFGTK